MISGKDYAVRFPDGDPTGSFECLGGFIYKQSGKAPSVEQTMVAVTRVEAITRALSKRSALIKISSSRGHARGDGSFCCAYLPFRNNFPDASGYPFHG